MIRVSVTELKNKLSSYLRLVKQGETVEVMERSVPIARLQGLQQAQGGDAHLQRLIRDGIVSPASAQAPLDLIEKPPVPCGSDPARAVIEERGDH